MPLQHLLLILAEKQSDIFWFWVFSHLKQLENMVLIVAEAGRDLSRQLGANLDSFFKKDED